MPFDQNIIVSFDDNFHRHSRPLTLKSVVNSWGYYHIFIAMHDTNTAQEKPTLVMRDTNTFFSVMQLTLLYLRI